MAEESSPIAFMHNYAMPQQSTPEIEQLLTSDVKQEILDNDVIEATIDGTSYYIARDDLVQENDGDESEEIYYYAEDGSLITTSGEIAGYLEDFELEALNAGNTNSLMQVTYPCPFCSDTFFSYEDLRVHIREHELPGAYKCYKCGKTFRGHGNYWRHMKAHSDDPKYKFPCEMCQKVFSQKANLIKHVNIHLGIKNFQCTICHKAFTQKANLKKHLIVHSGNLSFKCSICGKAFGQKANLDKHVKIHLGEYSFECEICHKKFIQKINCQKHMKTHNMEVNEENIKKL